MTTQLIQIIRKLVGTDFVAWQRTLRAMANLVRPDISKILDGRLRPEPLFDYRTRRGRGRPATSGMATSSSVPADALKGEETTPVGEGGEGDGRHEEIFSLTVPSMVTVPPTDELIFANGAELERWDACNQKLYSVLFLSTKGSANSFLERFAGRPDSRQQPDGQTAWKAMTEKYLNFSMQRCNCDTFWLGTSGEIGAKSEPSDMR